MNTKESERDVAQAHRNSDFATQPASSQDILELESFVPYQVVVLSGYFRDELGKIYARHGISVSEWRVIACAAANKSTTAIDMVSQVHLDEVAVHRAVTSLAKKGLLKQLRDLQDRRRKPVELTRQGRQIFMKVTPLVLSFEKTLLGRLSQSERVMLTTSLTILLRKLGLIDHMQIRKTE